MKLSDLLAENPSLDHEIDLEDGEMVADLLTLSRIVRFQDTDDCLYIGAGDATTGIIQYGMVSSARLQVEQWMISDDG